jgi:hypothetical protein
MCDAQWVADLADVGGSVTTACQNLATNLLSSVNPGLQATEMLRGTQMKQVYRVLAFLVAAGVAVQAASISYGMFGLIKWIEGGGTLDQSTELTPALGGYAGFSWHATGGIFILPVISLLFLISSFFAKVPGGIRWALIVLGVTVLQVALGLFSHSVAGLGWLHGINALALFGTAVMAGMRVGRAAASKVEADQSVAAPAS